uniref:Solute carrier family 22 member 15 (inferred by orthology to a human protein) n=1 Tax=Strongyloides venezuelensis TaxID=75913 RepID=A0A0K0FVW1_STRVS
MNKSDLSLMLSSDRNLNDVNRKKTKHHDLGNYQILLFIFTNIGLFPTAASMLVGILFEPSKEYCQIYNNGMKNVENSKLEYEFHSIFITWQLHCQNSYLHKIVTTFVMVGATIGAITSGYISDNNGRKPIIVGSLLLMAITNLMVSIVGTYSWYIFSIIFFIQGCGVGAYMSSHLILIIENLENPRSRLLVVCLNAWPLGLCFTALISYLTRHWIYFHILTSITSLIMGLLLYFFAHESHIWLNQNNLSTKALKIKDSINKFNSGSLNSNRGILKTDNSKILSSVTVIKANENDDNNTTDNANIIDEGSRRLSTLEIIKIPQVRIHLLVLAFSFFSSSIISFVMYFSLDSVAGDPYMNMFIMGIAKFSAGLTPYFLSKWFGRMTIFLFSLSLSVGGSWILIISWYGFGKIDGMFISILCQVLAATADPVFKINHLYSAELFPTSARNTCRGICNGASRIGSMLAPGVILLKRINSGAPYAVISVLLTLQWILGYLYLPETKNQMSLEDNNEESKT